MQIYLFQIFEKNTEISYFCSLSNLCEKIMYLVRLLLIILVTLFDSVAVIIHMTFSKSPDFHSFARRWARRLLKISGIEVVVEGSENLQKQETYIFIANHSSLFDIPVLQASIENDFRIIYKKELEKIPVFGYGLKKSPYIGIVREDPRKSMQSLELAIESVQKGSSVLVFPEGTRTKDGGPSEPKRGAFIIAAKSHKPIVPVAIKGTYEILSNGIKGISPRKVRVKIGTPIREIPQTRAEESALMDRTWEEVKKLLSQM